MRSQKGLDWHGLRAPDRVGPTARFEKEAERKVDRSLKFLYLSQEDVIAAGGLDIARTLADVEKVLSLRDKGQCQEPGSPIISWEGGIEGRRVLVHPAWVGGDVDVTGVKWIPGNPENPFKRNMPRASAIIILSDAITGFPLAIMDGTIVSAMRTGAATGVGAKYLARLDSEVIGLLGAGVQNRTQLAALKEVLPTIKLVKIYDIVPDRATAWAMEMSAELGLPIQVAGNARHTVEGSDVVVAATVGVKTSQAYVEPEWIAEGSLFANVSGGDPKQGVILHSDRVVVTMREEMDRGWGPIGEMHGQGLLKHEDVVELGEIINGKQAGRRNARERIFLSPRGLSIEDVIAAHSVYKVARAKGLGQELYLWREPKWI